jgi:hypothetical protein
LSDYEQRAAQRLKQSIFSKGSHVCPTREARQKDQQSKQKPLHETLATIRRLVF